MSNTFSQYFTKGDWWINSTVIDLMNKYDVKTVLDPYAGGRDLLEQVSDKFNVDVIGIDIDETICPPNFIGDSLISINNYDADIIITNPPYKAKNSAKRDGSIFYKYINDTQYSDVYELSIDKCLDSVDVLVTIIPETFIRKLNKKWYKHHIISVDIIEDNLFSDTDCPVCVVCIDKNVKVKDTKCMINGEYIMDFNELQETIPTPKKNIPISFNDVNGNIGIRCIDSTDGSTRISFCYPNELDYDISKISNSSRAITIINVTTDKNIKTIIDNCNDIIETYRTNSKDMFLAPFKGNTKTNKRRRRLDFKTARAIIEQGVESV